MVSLCRQNQKRWLEEWSLFRVSYLTSQPRGAQCSQSECECSGSPGVHWVQVLQEMALEWTGTQHPLLPTVPLFFKYGLQGILLELSPKHGWIGETLSSNMAHRVSQMLSITLSHDSVLVNVVSFLD